MRQQIFEEALKKIRAEVGAFAKKLPMKDAAHALAGDRVLLRIDQIAKEALHRE